MKRRTVLRRLGAVGVVSTGVAGTATASSSRGGDVERSRLDVSDVSGEVELDALVDGDLENRLSQRQLAALPDDTDPSAARMIVDPDAETIALADCCIVCCDNLPGPCPCECCFCDPDQDRCE